MLKQLNLLQQHGSMYEAAIYNADALYLIIYASLDLCYSLYASKHRNSADSCVISNVKQWKFVKISYFDLFLADFQSDFVDAVTNSGSIAYVSISFIDAVYRLLNERGNVFASKPSSVVADLIKGGNLKEFLFNFLFFFKFTEF